MSKITTFVSQYSKVPNINQSSTFENDTQVFLSEINNRVAQTNQQSTQMNAVASEINDNKNAVENALAIVQSQAVDGGYNQLTVDLKDSNVVNATQKSGYTKWKPISEAFYTEESTSFTYKFADTNQFLNFNGKIVDTFLNSAYDASKGGCVFDLVNEFPSVIIQDQATNGLNVQTTISKGDTVVVDREDINNGTWIQTEDGWIDNGNGSYTCDGLDLSEFGYFQDITNIAVGDEFIVSFDITSYTSGTLQISSSDGTPTSGDYTSLGTYTLRQTMISNDNLYFKSISFNGTISNISVKQVEETYRATEDTADMYDYDDTDGTVSVTKNETVIYCTGNNTNGTTGHFYLYINTTGQADASATNFNGLPTYWKDLGTATNMSLENPYFENRDDKPISNQIACLHKLDTNGTHTLHTEVLFNDALAIETPKAIMLKNGFGEVAEGCYSKGSDLYIFVGYWQTGNRGLYHPIYNNVGFGTRTNATGTYWEGWTGSTQPTSSVADMFSLNGGRLDSGTNEVLNVHIAYGSDRSNPQELAYGIIYPSQFIDMRELAYKPTKLEQKLIDEDKLFNQVNGISSTEYKVQYATIVDDYIHVLDNTIYEIGEVIEIIEPTVPSKLITTVKAKGNDANGDWLQYSYGTLQRTVGVKSFIIKQIPHNSQGQKLSTDLIGNPSNYPSMITDRLAEGKGLFGLYPLLVGQDGTDYTTGANRAIFYDKNIEINTQLYWNGTSWGSNFFGLDSIENTYDGDINTTSNMYLASYTSQNTLNQIDPMPILDVIEKVEASNSHSIYKGAIIGNSIGKIQTGNGTKGFVSKYLEDVNLDENDSINTTPSHNSINLDNSSSTASKWFKCYAVDVDRYLWVYVPIEQITYDNISEWGDTDFSQLTNGTIPDVNGGSDVITKIVGYCTGVRV